MNAVRGHVHDSPQPSEADVLPSPGLFQALIVMTEVPVGAGLSLTLVSLLLNTENRNLPPATAANWNAITMFAVT